MSGAFVFCPSSFGIVATEYAMFERLTTFLKEARIELKKVTWPTRRETIRYTAAVIMMSLAVAAFLGGLDAVFTFLLNTFVL